MEDPTPKRSKSTHPQTQIATTPTRSSDITHPDIISQILLKLSAKPLIRFKCVSKEWCNIISSPKFLKEYLRASLSAEDFARHHIVGTFSYPSSSLRRCSLRSVISEAGTESFDFADYPMKDPNPYNSEIEIHGSCNGLVLLCRQPRSLSIWNPTTGESITVPYYHDPHVGMSTYIYRYGLGYDEVQDDYKLIELFRDRNAKEYRAKMFSLRSGSWRVLYGGFKNNAIRLSVGVYCRSGMYVAGNIHWAIESEKDSIVPWDINVLNLAREEFGKLGHPDYGQVDPKITLGVVSGCLCVLNLQDLWVMKSYGDNESWSRIFTFPVTYDLRDRSFSPLCIVSGGILVSRGPGGTGRFRRSRGSRVAVYEPTDALLRFPIIYNFEGLIDAHVYVESMVSPSAYRRAERGQGGPE